MAPKEKYAYESDLQADILSFLKKEFKAGKCYYERRVAVGLTYRKGIPDFWFTKHGKHYEVELKRSGGDRSSLQVQYERIFKNIDVEYALIDSWQQFLEFYHKDDKSPDE